MEEQTQPTPLTEIRDIRRIMERSSRFISLSGLSGIAAGICALAGVFVANNWLQADPRTGYSDITYYTPAEFSSLKYKLTLLGAGVFAAAFLSSLYLTWQKAKKLGLPLWDHTSKRLAWNMLVPLIAGAGFILGMLYYNQWMFVAPACLIFYGLALVNASKYTLGDIRYLGYCEIILGIINMAFIGYGLWFWGIGFGVLHIIYGAIIWSKYK